MSAPVTWDCIYRRIYIRKKMAGTAHCLNIFSYVLISHALLSSRDVKNVRIREKTVYLTVILD